MDESVPERPSDISPGTWAEIWRPLPTSLREANRNEYDLSGVPLPSGVTLYPKAKFEREYKSPRSFLALVRRLGGLEPLVLSVSRPAPRERGDGAWVVLHVLSTWSGCGGVNQYRMSHAEGRWVVELEKVLVFW
jgi:hypothetical protein